MQFFKITRINILWLVRLCSWGLTLVLLTSLIQNHLTTLQPVTELSFLNTITEDMHTCTHVIPLLTFHADLNVVIRWASNAGCTKPLNLKCAKLAGKYVSNKGWTRITILLNILIACILYTNYRYWQKKKQDSISHTLFQHLWWNYIHVPTMQQPIAVILYVVGVLTVWN